MKRSLFFLWLFVLCAGIPAMTGCHSKLYYQNQAADEARDFLIEEAKELTLEQREFVRFNQPVFLIGSVLNKNKADDLQLYSYLNQVCITWIIPGREDAYLVFGVSNDEMYNWSPVRLIRKKFAPLQTNRLRAISLAQSYAWNNLYNQLSSAQANRIRFSEPEFVPTVFPPDFTSAVWNADAGIQDAKLKQISLVWPLEEQKVVVICGYANNDDCANWKINFGGILDSTELDAFRQTETTKEDLSL